jgi:hypothetical protein
LSDIKIIGGDVMSQKASYSSGSFIFLEKGNWLPKPHPISSYFEAMEEITEDNKVKFGSAVGWGVAGALLAGPLGLAAGAVLGGRGKKVLFAVKLSDGREFVAETDPTTYGKLRAAMIAGRGNRKI